MSRDEIELHFEPLGIARGAYRVTGWGGAVYGTVEPIYYQSTRRRDHGAISRTPVWCGWDAAGVRTREWRSRRDAAIELANRWKRAHWQPEV